MRVTNAFMVNYASGGNEDDKVCVGGTSSLLSFGTLVLVLTMTMDRSCAKPLPNVGAKDVYIQPNRPLARIPLSKQPFFDNHNMDSPPTHPQVPAGQAHPDRSHARVRNADSAARQGAEILLHKSLMGLQNPRLLGGDILFRFGRPRQTGRVYKYERSALASPVNLWPNGVIYFELDPSVSHLTELIYKVMQQFHDETCIRFIPRETDEPDFLLIEALRGCFSYIGRIGGEQTLSLGDGCEYRGTIAHELLHAVGFFHHQNRSDRDDFLDIVWENVAKGKENQFAKLAPHENILLNDFDYNSIMLYGPRTFGKTLDKVTMKPKREGVILLEVVEKQGLSALDVDSVNKLYKCDSNYNGITTT